MSVAFLDKRPWNRPPAFDPDDYRLAIKNWGKPPKPWRWEIFVAGKNKPVLMSEFFETMSEATRAGKAALTQFRDKRAA